MSKNESYPELGTEAGDNDDVEILEVVGVEDGTEPVIPSANTESDTTSPDEGPEYLLDFDAPDDYPLEGRDENVAPGGVVAEETEESGDSDHDRLLRLRADYANLRKRIDRERDEFELRANGQLVGRLLPVVDNLERALAANSAAPQEGPLREGLVMIHRQLTDQLSQEGLEPIESVGQPFDPALHDAVATEASSEHPANTIVEEMQKGYLFQNKVLRPAMVRVSTGNGGPGEDT
jgi:molecular chaperone GrpE